MMSGRRRVIWALIVVGLVADDAGAEARHLEIVGNGWKALNRPAEAMVFFNYAIADGDRDVGTPFMAYEGKAEALVMEGKMDEALALI